VPPGWYVWYLRATPYTPTSGRVNPAGTAEAQSQDRTPEALTLSAKAAGKKRATLTGRVTQGGRGIGKVKVQLLLGKRTLTTATTDGSGRFRATVRLPAATATLRARAVIPMRATTCGPAVFAPATCVNATIGGTTAASDPVRVRT
jgi:hypothetical protein